MKEDLFKQEAYKVNKFTLIDPILNPNLKRGRLVFEEQEKELLGILTDTLGFELKPEYCEGYRHKKVNPSKGFEFNFHYVRYADYPNQGKGIFVLERIDDKGKKYTIDQGSATISEGFPGGDYCDFLAKGDEYGSMKLYCRKIKETEGQK